MPPTTASTIAQGTAHDRDDASRDRRSERTVLREVVAPLLAGIVTLAMIAFYVLHALAASAAAATTLPRGAIDDMTVSAHYSSGWRLESGSGFANGTAHGSSTAGATATVDLSGSQVMLYGAVGPSSGIATVSVDGGPAYEVDFYAPVSAGARLLWISAPLVGRHHRLKVRVTGHHRDNATASAIDLDGFASIASSTRLAASSSALKYTSSWTSPAGAQSRRTSSPGVLDLRFTGHGAVLRGSLSLGSQASISIDGGAAQPIVFSGSSLWSSGPLRGGSHHVRLQLTSGSATVNSAWVYRVVRTMPIGTSTTRTSRGWATYVNNPVVGKNWGTSFDLAAIQQNGVYRMWFSWRPKAAIAYVESVDGVSWTAPKIVLAARPGTWESDVNRPSVIVTADGRYDMWYTGQNEGVSSIGFATSSDGLHWSRPGDAPVLIPQGWEKPSVMNASVVFDSSKRVYKMWFSGGQTQEPNAIGYATSPDGRTWTRYSTDPVLEKDPAHAWEQDRVAGIQVIHQAENRYLAFYIGYRDILTAAIGVARSSDGVHWERMSSSPLVASVPKTWDCDAVYKPFALWDAANDRWRLWFNGRCGGDEQLGMAVHKGFDLF